MADIHEIVWVTNPESKMHLRLARVAKVGFRGKVKLEGDKIFINDGFRTATETEERTFLSQEKLSLWAKLKRLIWKLKSTKK
jgi:hypothetical protein